ncbi:MAG: leucine--tRNA ligase [Phycisphaerae bacterium]|nr:leucine--tRNA ligase [Phycisphaerae bacterium]
MAGYDFKTIEEKWRTYWQDHGTFRVDNPGEEGFAPEKPKLYVLDMFPYPSGAGLHVGHPEGYTATDIVCRYMRMKGYNVLHPMGYDAFGLPAEQYAVEHGVHPRETTEENIANIERQIKMFGFSYDWSRRLATTDVDYYRWTQWIFLQLFNSYYDPEAAAARPIRQLIDRLLSGELLVDLAGRVVFPEPGEEISGDIFGMTGTHRKFAELDDEEKRAVVDDHRLAYMAEVPVNWCPKLGTVLANEEVTNEGRSERGDHPVYRRSLKQWMLRITAYAERLLADIETVDWPEPIKIMQRNWIGRSDGAEVDFPLESLGTDEWFEERNAGGFPTVEEEEVIRVYTTRPDTLYGTTYMVLAPEHPLVEQITTEPQRNQVRTYVKAAKNKSELDRIADTKEKTGVFTGAYAINPVNRRKIPIWVADYVMMGYGTGAIMAVPAHDERDFAFAMNFDLPITPILKRRDEADARYFVGTGHEESAKIYEAFKHNPDAFSALRGIDFGPVVHESDDNTPFIPNAAHEKFFDLDDSPKLWIFVGPTAHQDAASLAGLSSYGRAVPRCNPSMNEEHEYIHSGPLNGLSPAEGKKKITDDLEAAGMGKGAVNYKLRDWLFSRQRYWGEPFPIVHCETCGTVPLPEDQLPLTLPAMDDFRPDSTDNPEAPPQPPLGKATDWIRTACPNCGRPATRELNTMPQWAGSCWYYLRYLDPKNSEQFVSPDVERYWMNHSKDGGVDLYVGGAEHAVLHLLYSRFWHKVLYDLGHVSTPEPFHKLFNQGMIRSFAYRDDRGVYIGYENIDFRDDGAYHKKTNQKLSESVEKMSKSLKNVVNPDDVIEEYGADTFRLYEMFMGPLEASKPWNTRDVPGAYRFLQRVWRMCLGDEENGIRSLLVDETEMEKGVEKALHKLIKKVAEDIEAMKFNTAIAAMMDFVNTCYKAMAITQCQVIRFLGVLNPFAPHITEEIAEQLGRTESIAYESWPPFDERMIEDETVEVPVQINGKVRSRVTVPAKADDDAVLELVLADRKIAPQVAEKKIVKKIVVPGKLVNLVVK